MPCENETHDHQWPQSGALVIERCEVFCQYCPTHGKERKLFKFAWFLRRHVRMVHIKEGKGTHPNVELAGGWTGKLDGSKTTAAKNNSSSSLSEKKKAVRRARRSESLSNHSSPESSPSPPYSPDPSENGEAEAEIAESEHDQYAEHDQYGGHDQYAEQLPSEVYNGTLDGYDQLPLDGYHGGLDVFDPLPGMFNEPPLPSSDDGLSDFDGQLPAQSQLAAHGNTAYDAIEVGDNDYSSSFDSMTAPQLYNTNSNASSFDSLTALPSTYIETNVSKLDTGFPYNAAADSLV